MSDDITELPTKLNPLPDDARAAKSAALKARKVFASAFSPFVKAMRECMAAYLQARAAGVERADAAKGIEEVLRASWPKPTTKFGPQCLLCDDTGYEESLCRQWARCERQSCQRKGEEFQHLYVRPCECAKGQGFQRAAMRKAAPEVVGIETVGNVKKPKRGWRQIGS